MASLRKHFWQFLPGSVRYLLWSCLRNRKPKAKGGQQKADSAFFIQNKGNKSSRHAAKNNRKSSAASLVFAPEYMLQKPRQALRDPLLA
jgi:hypothetical protein